MKGVGEEVQNPQTDAALQGLRELFQRIAAQVETFQLYTQQYAPGIHATIVNQRWRLLDTNRLHIYQILRE